MLDRSLIEATIPRGRLEVIVLKPANSKITRSTESITGKFGGFSGRDSIASQQFQAGQDIPDQ
jgi:hypothetical protein